MGWDRKADASKEGESMAVARRLDISVAGERWRPVRTLARCGPDDHCYVVQIDDDGGAKIMFGDGVTGQRPSAGEVVEVTYRRGAGRTGNVPLKHSPTGSDTTLVELFAQIGDLLNSHQDQVAYEAYLETARVRSRVVDSTDLWQAIASSRGEISVCINFQARSSQRQFERRGRRVQ